MRTIEYALVMLLTAVLVLYAASALSRALTQSFQNSANLLQQQGQ